MNALNFNAKALLANFVIWSIFISVSLSASLVDSGRAGIDINYTTRTLGYLISFGPWMLITPFFYWFLQRQHRSKQLSMGLAALILLAAWAPFVSIFETFSYMVIRSDNRSFFEIMRALPIFYWTYCLVLYGVVMGACLSLLYYRRSNENKMQALKTQQQNVELELQLSELRIQSLLSQLEPHFLFNSLNSIASLVRIADKKQALSAIKRLSDLLRFALEAGKQKFVSFENELDFVRDYLSLQSLRFEDKLSVAINDNRNLKNQECPPFLLQTFVENAIKHGMERNGSAMSLSIYISDTDSQFKLEVENTQQSTGQTNNSLGIGLQNLTDRLQILYQEKIDLFTESQPELYRVNISIPLRGQD